jgi:hypothetical protein
MALEQGRARGGGYDSLSSRKGDGFSPGLGVADISTSYFIELLKLFESMDIHAI